MTIEQALKKAIEGGYEVSCGQRDIITGHDPQFRQDNLNITFFDPLFWQALFKDSYFGKLKVFINVWHKKEPRSMATWQYQWHRLIDTLSKGKSAEDFFEDLN